MFGKGKVGVLSAGISGARTAMAAATVAAIAVTSIVDSSGGAFHEVVIWLIGIAVFREVALLSLTYLAEAENSTHNELDDILIHAVVCELR